MPRRVPLAWPQLSKDRLRLAIATAGVAFAVVLVSMQLGFREAMYEAPSATTSGSTMTWSC